MKTGSELRDEGIQQALFNADTKEPKWSAKAYAFLQEFLNERNAGELFLVEDVRAESTIAEPPSKRAWGGIIVKARNAGLIRAAGYDKVNNPKAHCATATLWMKL